MHCVSAKRSWPGSRRRRWESLWWKAVPRSRSAPARATGMPSMRQRSSSPRRWRPRRFAPWWFRCLLGVLFAIMPWNFPYWQVVRALAPALAAGNVVVLKHAPSTTGCALALAEVADAAGLPTSTLSVLVVAPERTADVAATVIGDDRVAAVTLTGSTRAGRSVAAVAGQALKKTVLELGGSDAFVVLADADLDAAAAWAARSRFQNTGQSCIAAKRIVVEEQVADAFTEKLLEYVRALRLGEPDREMGVTVGPLAREDLRDARRAPGPRIRSPGCADLDRRTSSGPAGLLLRADRPRSRAARHAGPRRGGLRPCGPDPPSPRQGRSAAGSPTTATTASAARCGHRIWRRARRSPLASRPGIRP